MKEIQTFETKMRRLEAIVAEFSKEDIPLDQMLVTFKEGKQLIEELKQALETAELEINTFIKGNEK
ncbi:MAG: exodeoxyribonuclease VII small subunit [Erysipelotrichaceae bacterium]|jgi:exodeoxyribonuclease VII small subunit|nr:exodeoxyribonuclease VII small subunit [Erysipelotrichaceae bacterium]